MYLHGSFINQSGDTITVHILTHSDRTDERIIGTTESGIYFTDDPIDIEAQVNDTFDHILPSQATIRFLVTNYIPQLFTPSATDAIVNIYRADTPIFAGYIEPRAYSQAYNETLDQLELSCIDHLTAIDDLPYRLLTTDAKHQAALATADQLTLQQFITDIIATPSARLDILHPDTTPAIYYDGSKCIDSIDAIADNRWRTFSYITLNELLFLGTDRDDLSTQADIITAILQYLNLHIIQQGLTYYIYSWETIRATTPTEWHDIIHPTSTPITIQPHTITITTPIVTDTDTEFSLADIYNHLALTATPTTIDDLIESPLDDELLTSPYRAKQLLLTEYLADKSLYSLSSMQTYVFTGEMNSSHIWANDWYLQVLNAPQWAFPLYRSAILTQAEATIATNAQAGTWQENVPHLLASHIGAALLSIGRTTHTYDKERNGDIDAKIDMKNQLVISVNGNLSDDTATTRPNADDLLAAAPVATYRSAIAGGTLSPADTATTNYIVISGKIALQPILGVTEAYNTICADDPSKGFRPGFTNDEVNQMYFNRWYKDIVPVDNKSDGYKIRKYYTSPTPDGIARPTDTLQPDHTRNERAALTHTFVPFDDNGRQYLQFRYSAIGDSADHIRKLGCIACMLIIGRKCLVEVGNSGTPDDYQWQPYMTLEQCEGDLDKYYAQSFTIGFDPDLGDNLLGKEFSIQNNITHPLGIEAEGTAIPIRQSDHLSGSVTFHILGPANLVYNQVTRRHPTWFRHTKWTTNSIPLMAHVQNIILSDFNIKVYTDNALVTTYQDSDIIYQSDTDETFINTRDDIEFTITSALTAEERYQLGTTATIDISTPATLRSNGQDLTTAPQALLTIYDVPKHTQVKPEQDYIDSYYTEYHTPHILLTQSITDTVGTTHHPTQANLISPFNHYTHPALSRTFHVQSINRNLQSATATLTLKEITDQ